MGISIYVSLKTKCTIKRHGLCIQMHNKTVQQRKDRTDIHYSFSRKSAANLPETNELLL